MDGVVEVVRLLTTRPFIIITPTTYTGYVLEGGDKKRYITEHCIRIKVFSIEEDVLNPVYTQCYSDEETRDRVLAEIASIVKSKRVVRKMICVEDGNGTCFRKLNRLLTHIEKLKRMGVLQT